MKITVGKAFVRKTKGQGGTLNVTQIFLMVPEHLDHLEDGMMYAFSVINDVGQLTLTQQGVVPSEEVGVHKSLDWNSICHRM